MEFIQSLGDDNQLFEQIKQYEIKDFQLCYTDQIRQLYASSISDFQHLFADISQLLRAAIDYQLDEELSQNLTATIISIDDNKDIEKIKSIIQTITDLLNDLRSVEHFLLRQSNHSLTNTCEILDIKSSILDLIPHEIKCENYVAVSIHLIRMRTILQERPEQENRFLNFLNEPSTSDTTPKNNTESDDDYDDIWKGIPSSIPNELIKDNLLDKQDFPQQCRNSTIQPTTSEEYLEYSSLFELNLKFVPLTLSTLFDQIHKQFEQAQAQTVALNKAQKFIVKYTNEKSSGSLWMTENLFEKLRNLFGKEKFDMNTYAVIDKNEMCIDFTNISTRLSHEISLEYVIIEKTLLFSIQFNYQKKLFEYFATSKCNISTIIYRFIRDNDIKLSSNNGYLCFFDEHGKTIENGTIADLINQSDHPENRTISITVNEEDNQTSMLCEITIRSKQNNIFFTL
ncbi:unnamed protein product [Rotaria magnacalcarata]|uniref:Uncharacterized protein n=3 Tax=Rotaria magnacalcarata TaxID=392030 RepID=A0A816W091_9BILA|nr:unnamed protein product [Rotaria magnacalcarata]